MDNLNSTNPQNNPTPPPAPPMSSWPPPPPPAPEPAAPIPDPTPTWTPPAAQPEPMSAPSPEPATPTAGPTPTFIPPQAEQPKATTGSTIQPSWTAVSEPPPAASSESAPTDLSHLISNNLKLGQETPVQPVAETLVVPPVQNNPEQTPLPVNHKGIPRWLIGISIGLLILVAGASAYFILGIGQTKTQTTTSLPATIVPRQTEVQPPPPIPNSPVAAPAATGSANFGALEGSGGTQPQATSSSLEKLRQRQQGR